jgi:protein-tyrosine phosphatase
MNYAKQLEELMTHPLQNGKASFFQTSQRWIDTITAQLKEEQADRAKLGKMLADIKKLQKQIKNLEIIPWVPVLNGSLSIGHKPSKKMIADLGFQGCTHLLTLLSEKERAKEIKQQLRSTPIEWLWLPMENAKEPESERQEEIITLFQTIQSALEQGARLYIHCSAGIHRTGMITCALLGYLQFDEKKLDATLQELRQETYNGVGEERRIWAKKFAKRIQQEDIHDS